MFYRVSVKVKYRCLYARVKSRLNCGDHLLFAFTSLNVAVGAIRRTMAESPGLERRVSPKWAMLVDPESSSTRTSLARVFFNVTPTVSKFPLALA